ncbi:MAG: hypothetical protein ACR2LC_14810 [Pyrinomonadaceae bacterium]
MMKLLTDTNAIEEAAERINELIASHSEWFVGAENESLRTTSLRKDELDISIAQGRLILSYWNEAGALHWRITGWEWTGAKLLCDAARNLNRTRTRLEIIPRTQAKTIAAGVSAARRASCERLAALAAQTAGDAQIEKAGLSAGVRRDEPGRHARIILFLSRPRRERIAVAGYVTEANAGEVDALLSSALLWFLRVRERAARPAVRKLWLIVNKECLAAVRQRVALLRDDLRDQIAIYEIDSERRTLTAVAPLNESELWPTESRARVRRAAAIPAAGDIARGISAIAPEAIDVVRARHGETLRYHGLAFARVRRVMNREHVWFGTEGKKRKILSNSTAEEWHKLLRELIEHRHANAADHRHALYRAAPEAWLESLLRRDITRLDPGLIIAPLHREFRVRETSDARNDVNGNRMNTARPVDLLALRQDGRLVVIELKVSEDREHVLQGVDYWHRVEAYRQTGGIGRARLFGNAVIADEPPLVYLVAPGLRFHRAFQTLAGCIDTRIEIYRFDLNEDWRAGVRVMRRVRAP